MSHLASECAPSPLGTSDFLFPFVLQLFVLQICCLQEICDIFYILQGQAIKDKVDDAMASDEVSAQTSYSWK